MKIYIRLTRTALFYTSRYQMFSIPNKCGFSYDKLIRNNKFGVVDIHQKS